MAVTLSTSIQSNHKPQTMIWNEYCLFGSYGNLNTGYKYIQYLFE